MSNSEEYPKPASPTKTVVEATGEELELETESRMPRKPSESEDMFSSYIMEFAKRNYRKIVMGKQIKINGMYYKINDIPESLEDDFARLEDQMNKASMAGEPKKSREALYEFMTFASSITKEQLANVDRGELRNIALILGMMQKGFRDL